MTGTGYEIVEGLGGTVKGLYSFRVLLGDQPVKDLQTPLWFHTKAAAKGCAEDCVKKLSEHLTRRLAERKRRRKVEVFRF